MLIYFKVNVFRFILIIILFLLSSSSFAIINYQSYLREKNRYNGFKLSIEGLFSYYNEQHLRVSGASVFRYINGSHTILLAVSGGYGQTRKEVIDNKRIKTSYLKRNVASVTIHSRYYVKLLNWFGLEYYGQYEFNEFIRINTRALGGGGVRFNIIDNPIEISIGTSYFFEYNRYDKSNNSYTYTDSGQKTNYHRWSSYLNIGFDFNDAISLFSTLYFQPSFADFLNYRILNENQFKVNISKVFAVVLKLHIYHDSLPPDQVSSTHLRIISSIRVTI